LQHLLTLVMIIGTPDSLLIAQSPAAATPDDDAVSLLAKGMDRLKTKLLAGIDAKRRTIFRSKADPDEMRRILSAIEEDRRAFVEEDRLPNSDELIDVTIAYLKDCQPILNRAETIRRSSTTRAVRTGDADAMDALVALERRLNALTVGRDQFTAGSVWTGRRSDANGSLLLRLQIQAIVGNSFRGQLSQTGNFGRPDEMTIDGNLRGNCISFETTGMILGRARKLRFQGYLVGDRILAHITGTSADRKPVNASVSLSEGSDG